MLANEDSPDYHPRSKRTQYLHIRISDEDRVRLARLTRARRVSGAEVVRALILEAVEREG